MNWYIKVRSYVKDGIVGPWWRWAAFRNAFDAEEYAAELLKQNPTWVIEIVPGKPRSDARPQR